MHKNTVNSALPKIISGYVCQHRAHWWKKGGEENEAYMDKLIMVTRSQQSPHWQKMPYTYGTYTCTIPYIIT